MNKTKLTSGTVEQALNCIAISYATREGCKNDSRSEIWFCDLALLVEAGGAHQEQSCLIGVTIEHIRVSDKIMLMIHPYDIIDNWLTGITETELTDEKAIKYLREHVKRLIEVIAVKGIHSSRGDGGWKIGGKKKNIYFLPTEPRGKGSRYPEDWRILYDPTGAERGQREEQ